MFFFCYTQFFQTSKSEKKTKINISAPVELTAPQKIYKSGYYQLTADIVPTSINQSKDGACSFFSINAPDVVFDGMGHVIDGSRISPPCTWSTGITGFGVPDSPAGQFKYPRITVRNVTIMNLDSGIGIRGAQDVRIENVTIIGNNIRNNTGGIYFKYSSNLSIINSTFNVTGSPINGDDNENVAIINNRISNSRSGISFDEDVTVAPEITIFGQRIVLFYFVTTTKKTSGTGYLISHNTIQNISGTGITIGTINDIQITDNRIVDNKRGMWVHRNNGPDLVIENNTYIGNTNDVYTTYSPRRIPLSAIIGTFLIFLLPILTKILTGTSNIVKKITTTKIVQKFLALIHSVEDQINAIIRNNSILNFIRSPITVTVVGAVIFGGAYAYATSVKLTWTSVTSFLVVITSFSSILIISGIVTVIPRAIQYLVAKKNSLIADYRIWWGGIFVILVTMLLPLNSIFGQPVKMEVSDKNLMEKKKIVLSKISGPLTTILLSCIFYILYLLKVTPLSMVGLHMSLLTSVVMLLPVSPVEGEYVWKWNRITWGILFFPVLIAYFSLIFITT